MLKFRHDGTNCYAVKAHRKQLTVTMVWQSKDRASWYILIMKANKMHSFWNLFDIVLYTFQTCSLSIIRSISTLYTYYRYLSFYLCWRLLAEIVQLVGFHYVSNNGVGPKDSYITVMTGSPLLAIRPTYSHYELKPYSLTEDNLKYCKYTHHISLPNIWRVCHLYVSTVCCTITA